MAATDDSRRGAPGNHEDPKLTKFHMAMKNFHRYPYNLDLRHTKEKVKFVGDFRQHFDQTKDDILLLLKQNVRGFRRKLIEKKIRVQIHDAGLRDANSNSTSMSSQGQPPITPGTSSSIAHVPRMQWGEESFASAGASNDDTDVYLVSNSKHLEDTFGINSLHPPANPQDFKPRADPVCRFIFLATAAPTSRRIKITEELLLQILTYHQVSPCFLNFISYFGHDPLSGGGDLFFGGFRSLKSFAEPLFKLEALGRSGYHYQLAFELRTVFRPPSEDAEHFVHRQLGEREVIEEATIADDLRRSWIRRRKNNNNNDNNSSNNNNNNIGAVFRMLPAWLRLRDDNDGAGEEAATASTTQTSDNPDLWPLDKCAIYHHFDVENGKSLWMITAAEGEGNKPPPERDGPDTPSESEACQPPSFRDVKDARFSGDISSTSSVDERFRASLSVLLWLADWSLSEYAQYITMLDDDLQKLTRPYIEDTDDGGPVHEIGIKKLNGYMEKLDEIIVALQANLRVCKAALRFYRDELLQDRKLKTRNLAWLADRDARARIREDLADFEDKMRWVCTSTQEMLRRAVVVKQVGVHRLLQNRDVRTTNELAIVTHKDSRTMRVFSTITLVLLPMSVVSTVFSTDIVDFQPGSGGGFAGSWSGPGALWWAVTTVLVTLLVSWAAATAGKAGTVPSTASGSKDWNDPNVAGGVSRDHDDESWGWMTRVRRGINDARVSAGPYKHAIRVAHRRVVGFLTRPARESAPSDRARGSPQQLAVQQPEVSEAMASPEGGELRGKGFEQASTVEQGLSPSYSTKEVVTVE
ncbi:hypothetical protein C8A01DRAFT_35128 [Parachaetomium inaequale]|uniref:CorA-like transporter domain-containing protein n=1 Tax=Parachaetomium inaequale TaxID=2588326 RepID=A0AAN6SSE0_9PEZI|nr:hypothetical protein C8A01DRAFT_35128 [Parachaetomium inaequale]